MITTPSLNLTETRRAADEATSFLRTFLDRKPSDEDRIILEYSRDQLLITVNLCQAMIRLAPEDSDLTKIQQMAEAVEQMADRYIKALDGTLEEGDLIPYRLDWPEKKPWWKIW